MEDLKARFLSDMHQVGGSCSDLHQQAKGSSLIPSTTVLKDFPSVGSSARHPSATPRASSSQQGVGPWSSLFSSDSDARLQFHSPQIAEGRKVVSIPKAVHELGTKLWENCLIAQFYGLNPSFFCIQAMISKLWAKNGKVEAISLDSGRFLFKFENVQTVSWVLNAGPSFIDQRPMLLKRWKSGIKFEDISLDCFPIWVKLWHVPLELFTNERLSRIASAIGELLYMDKATELSRRLNFARVCVEVGCSDDLSDTIPLSIKDVGCFEVKAEYSWRPSV